MAVARLLSFWAAALEELRLPTGSAVAWIVVTE
jgi:hypothetical protein